MSTALMSEHHPTNPSTLWQSISVCLLDTIYILPLSVG